MLICSQSKSFSKGNIVVTLSQFNSTLRFNVKTRTRFGYAYVGFSKYRDSLLDAQVIFSYVNSLTEVQGFRFKGSSGLDITPSQFMNASVKLSQGTNHFPLGKYVDDINLYLSFDNKVVKFDNFTWIHITTKWNYENPSPTTFDTVFDERISIQILNITDLDYAYTPPTPSLENFHYGAFSFTGVIIILIFFLGLIFHTKQPMKSRGIIPFISCIFQFIYLMGSVPFFFFTFEDYKFYCIIQYLTQHSSIIILLFLTTIHFIRYLLIVNHQQGKNVFIQNKYNGDAFDIRLRWKVIKFLGKGYVQFITLIFLYILVCVTFVFGFTGDEFTCSRSYLWVGIYFISLVGVFVILLIICIIFDIIINIQKCKKILSLWKEDVYYYRTELILCLVLATPLFILSKVLNPDFIVTYGKTT